MKILYASDIHIEIRESVTRTGWTATYPLDIGPDLSEFVGAVDLAVLAGDIGRLRSSRNVSPLPYAQQVAAYLGCPVVLVPGNHEYYRASFEEARAELRGAKMPGVTVLDRNQAFFPRPDDVSLRVLGATLWTDYALLGGAERAMQEADQVMVDHRLIRRRGGSAPWRPVDALREHRLSRRWLAQKLGEPHDGPTLVVTHHVPHPAAAHPGHGLNALSPAFCSDLGDLIAAANAAGVIAWIYGHDHWSHEVEVEGLRLLSAQPGYPGEESNWRGPGLLEI